MVNKIMNYKDEMIMLDKLKHLKPRMVEGNLVSCSGEILDDGEVLEYRGTIKKKKQRVPPRKHLMCLNCSFIQQLELFHTINQETYRKQKKKMDEQFFNQRRRWKEGMKPFEYLKEFNDEMEIFLKKLKENHIQEFQDVKDECIKQERW